MRLIVAGIVGAVIAWPAVVTGQPVMRAAAPSLSAPGLDVQFTPYGAGIDLVQLPMYPETLDNHQPYRLIRVDPASPNVPVPLATMGIDLHDPQATIDLTGPWQSVQPDQPETVAFSTTAAYQGQAILALTKTYRITPGRYDMAMGCRIANVSDRTQRFSVVHAGPVGMPREEVQLDMRSLYVARDDNGAIATKRLFRPQRRKMPAPEALINTADQPIRWWAVGNKYFAAILAPDSSISLDLIAVEPSDQLTGQPFHCRWTSATIILEPGQSIELATHVYLGPQDRQQFADDATYARLDFASLIDAHGSACTLDALGRGMAWLLRTTARYMPSRNYGLAILVIAVLFRVVLAPLSWATYRSQSRQKIVARKLRPEVDRLRKQSHGDRQALAQAVAKLYRDNGVTRSANAIGCLPMLIQIPIWGAMWTAINTTIGVRCAPFVLWIRDLSAPDALLHFDHSHAVPVFSWLAGPIDTLNVLPLLLGAAMLGWQLLRHHATDGQKLRPGAVVASIVAMVLVTALLYKLPSGLLLHILASTTINGLLAWRVTRRMHREIWQDATV